jgi:hypothetical protein
MITREEKIVKVGKYAVRIKGDNFNLAQNIKEADRYQGHDLTCFVWVKTNVPNKYRIQLYDGFSSSVSDRHTGSDEWELLNTNIKVSRRAQIISVRLIQAEKTGKLDDVVFIDGAIVIDRPPLSVPPVK